MLYGRYLLLKEEEELLKGVRMFPDVFASLYDYLAVMEGFNTSKYSGRYNGRALASCMFKGRELSRILRSLNQSLCTGGFVFVVILYTRATKLVWKECWRRRFGKYFFLF